MKRLKDEFEYQRLVQLLREMDEDRLDALSVYMGDENEESMEDSKLFTVSQFSKLSGIPASTIRKWCAAGTIKAKRIGERKWYITAQEVQRIIEQADATETPEA